MTTLTDLQPHMGKAHRMPPLGEELWVNNGCQKSDTVFSWGKLSNKLFNIKWSSLNTCTLHITAK